MNKSDTIAILAAALLPVALFALVIYGIVVAATRPFSDMEARCHVFQIACGTLALVWPLLGQDE